MKIPKLGCFRCLYKWVPRSDKRPKQCPKCKSPYDAFAYLDIHNMRKVIVWCASWGVELPKLVAELYKLEEEAASNLPPGFLD